MNILQQVMKSDKMLLWIVLAISVVASKVENTSWKDFLFGSKWKMPSSGPPSVRDSRCMCRLHYYSLLSKQSNAETEITF